MSSSSDQSAPAAYPSDGPVVSLGSVRCGGREPLAVIAGPCVVESEDRTLRIAEEADRIARRHGFPLVFKASYDKANRTSGQSFRGPGLEEGLRILGKVRTELGLTVLTDVHLPEQAVPASEIADVLQLPAFLCRQTDLIAALAQTGRALNLKKGQFLAPEDMAHVVKKARAFGAKNLIVTERGTSFGYRDLVVDYRGLATLRRLGVPVCFDATHSVQRPASEGSSTGGDRTLAPVLARAAVAVGVDALFAEVHDEPDAALSDAANSLDFSLFDQMLSEARRIRDALMEVTA